MTMARVLQRLRRLRTGLVLLTRIYHRDKNLPRLAQSLWRVGVREGSQGLKHWIFAHSVSTPIPTNDSSPTQTADPAEQYREWLARYDILRTDRRQAALNHMARSDLPEVLILAVIRQSELTILDQMIASWRSSLHGKWTAAFIPAWTCDVDDQERVLQAIAGEPRIHFAMRHQEIEALRAQGAGLILTFKGTFLNCLSTYMFLEAAHRTGAALIYSDHDHVNEHGRRSDPAFKPQFSPCYVERLNYVGDCIFINDNSLWGSEESASLFEMTEAGFDSQIARLLGRCSARNLPVEHLPFLLFHVLGPPRPRTETNNPPIEGAAPSVSMILTVNDNTFSPEEAINAYLADTSYDLNLIEVVVVDNRTSDARNETALAPSASSSTFSLRRCPGSFSRAELNNVGAKAAAGDILVFLDCDLRVMDSHWLTKLVAYAQKPGVAAVSGKLLSPDGTIQHGGHVAGGDRGYVRDLLGHTTPEAEIRYDHTREMSVLTASCLAVRRDLFEKLGGFDPVLRTHWHGTHFCLSALSGGLRNIYIADPLLIQADTGLRQEASAPRHVSLEDREADYTRREYRDYFYDDPFYNPNRSLEQSDKFAEPPRVRFPWHRLDDRPPRILLLSLVYRRGYGVPVVMQQHARRLLKKGYAVFIGGPAADQELTFPGCERVHLHSSEEAAVFAFTHDIALIVSHTPPFFEIPLFIGGHIPVLAHDHGEPSAHFFQGPTREYLIRVGNQKKRSAALTTRINVISRSVKEETLYQDASIVPNANSHMIAWSETLRPERERFREEHGWQEKVVVLTVCRFHEGERAYKGIDKISEIIREFPYLFPQQSQFLHWILAGAGNADDVSVAEALGFTVYPNVSDATLADIYKGADAYVSFSKWEGYNLGIAQAMAMGLPILASDIPPHREFGVKTTDSILVACNWLAAEVDRHRSLKPIPRTAIIYDWEVSADAFVDVVEEMLHRAAKQKPRLGASVVLK